MLRATELDRYLNEKGWELEQFLESADAIPSFIEVAKWVGVVLLAVVLINVLLRVLGFAVRSWRHVVVSVLAIPLVVALGTLAFFVLRGTN